MSVCWKPGWCECEDCGPLDPGPVSNTGYALMRECHLCGEFDATHRFHRTKPGVLIDGEGNELPYIAIVERHHGCTPREGS